MLRCGAGWQQGARGAASGTASNGTGTGTGEIEAILRAHHEMLSDEQAAAEGNDDDLDEGELPWDDSFAKTRPAPAAVGMRHLAPSSALPEPNSSPLFHARQQALWRTLEEAGLLSAAGGEAGWGSPACSEVDCHSDVSSGSGSEQEHTMPRTVPRHIKKNA